MRYFIRSLQIFMFLLGQRLVLLVMLMVLELVVVVVVGR